MIRISLKNKAGACSMFAATLHMDWMFGLSEGQTLTGGGVGGGCKLLLDALEDSAHPAGQGHWGHLGHGHSLNACNCTSLHIIASWAAPRRRRSGHECCHRRRRHHRRSRLSFKGRPPSPNLSDTKRRHPVGCA